MTTDAPRVRVLADEGGPGVVRVLLDRPPANAFDLAFYAELADTFEALAADPPAAVQLGSSVSRFFSGGRDLKEPQPTTTTSVGERARTVTRLYDVIVDLPCPTIAVVEGFALGAGCVVASVCDVRIATTAATFGIPEVTAGSVGGARHLMRLLPHGVVRRMALTGESIDGRRADALGMADLVGDGVDPWAEADRLAASLAALDGDGLRRVKWALNASEDLGLAEGFAVELRARKEAPDASDAG